MLNQLLNNDSLSNRIGKNIFWLVAEKFTRYGLALLVGIWMARYTGTDGFGILSNIIAFVTLFTPLYGLGIDAVSVRELTLNPDHRKVILGTGWYLRLAGSLLTLLLCIAWFWNYNALYIQMAAITCIMPLMQSWDVTDFYFQSVLGSKYTVSAKMAGLIAVLSLRVIFILGGFSLIWFAWANAAEFMAAAIALIYIYQKHTHDFFQWRFDRNMAVKLLKNSWPVALSMAGTFIYYKSGQIQLGAFNNTWAGIYAAGIRFSEFWYFVPGILFVSVYPSLVKLYHDNPPQFKQKMIQLHRYLFYLCLMLCMCIYFLSDLIIEYTYGKQFSGAEEVLKIHIWSTLSVFIAQTSQIWYMVSGNIKYIVFNNFLGAVSVITLNIILIPEMGPAGAAYSCVISYILATFVAPFLIPSTYSLGKQIVSALLFVKIHD